MANTYPNPLAPDVDKNSKEYGLKLMRAAYSKWNQGVGESASARKNRIEYNRLFAMGKQPMEEYKDILDLDGDDSVINLDYSPLPIAIPFMNRLIDRYMKRIEKIQCNAIDPFTQTKKEKAKANALFKLKNAQEIQQIQQEAGVQLEEFSENDPKDEQELELQFGFNYKEREEVIMEQGIDLVMYDNNWQEILKRRILYDLFTAGIAQVKPYINGNGRLKIKFTKPENIISSYTEWDDFRDAEVKGEIYGYLISDIRQKYPDAVKSMGGEEALFNLAQSNGGLNGNSAFDYAWTPEYNQALARPYDGYRVNVVELTFKTINNIKREVNTDRFGKEILDKVKTIKEGKEYIQSNTYEVEYTGVWIIDTDYVLEWGLTKNMNKSEKNLTEVISSYVTYMYGNNKMVNTPMIETMIPSIKMMQLVSLQQQKIIAAAAPDGYMVDIAYMSDVELGIGTGSLDPYQLYKIFKQTGIQYYKSVGDSGEERRDPPIKPTNIPFSGKLEQLMSVWNQEYDKLIRIVGSNNLDSGNITNQATGKQVLQDARQIGESASNYIYDGYLNMFKRTGRIIMLQLSTIFLYGKKWGIEYYDGYVKSMGTDRIEYLRLEATDDFEKCQFDIKVEAVIDDNEANLLEQNIQVCLSNDTISLQDAIDVRLLAKSNIKYASYMLANRQKKRIEQKQKEALENSKANTEQAVAAAQAKSKGDMQLEDMKFKNEMALKKEETEAQKEREISKFSSILKSNIASAILAKEGTTIKDLPSFIFEGLDVIAKSNKQVILEEMSERQKEMEQEAMAEQQALEQQQAQIQEPQGEAMKQ